MIFCIFYIVKFDWEWALSIGLVQIVLTKSILQGHFGPQVFFFNWWIHQVLNILSSSLIVFLCKRRCKLHSDLKVEKLSSIYQINFFFKFCNRKNKKQKSGKTASVSIVTPLKMSRQYQHWAGHFRYFLIFSLTKNDFLHFL